MDNALYVAWRSGDANDGQWGPVGRLEHHEGGYRFVYTRGAEKLPGFTPFPEMKDLHGVYEADVLFPLFANRLLAKSRPEYEAFLVWGGFNPQEPPDPIAVLGVTEGRRATDALELFPCPQRDAEGCFNNKFFLHGLRWMAGNAIERASRLQADESLGLMLDIQNRRDPHAVAVRTCDVRERYMIGYVPRYLARDVWHLVDQCGPDSVQLTVERINTDAPMQQRVLCRLRACWPEGFSPCFDEDFQPLARVHSKGPSRVSS